MAVEGEAMDLVPDPGSSKPAPDKALTVKKERIAGSPACLNCGTALQGPYCHYCGQPDRNFLRFFPALLRDLMEDFLDVDSRFIRTMKPLLFKPGRLTRDFLEGRRFRYTPPMRLYIFSSVVFFLMAATLSTDAIRVVQSPESDETNVQFSLSTEQRQALDEETAVRVDEALAHAGEADGDDDFNIQFNDQPWDRVTNPVYIPELPDFINDWINDEIADSPRKAQEIGDNPRLMVDKIFDVLPVTMFVLLPVAALLYKFWYLFARRYYIEHLIFALHNHAFIFVTLILALLLGVFEDACVALQWQTAAGVFEGLAIAVMAWMPVYFLLAMKHVYAQGWFLTTLKYGLVGLSYLMLLGFVTSAVAIIGFVML